MMSTISKWNCTCINSWKQLWSSTNFYWASKSWSLYCILPYFGIHIATSICMYVYIYKNVYAYVHMHMCIHIWIYVKTCLRVLLLNMGVLHCECCMMHGKQSPVKYGNKLDLIWFDFDLIFSNGFLYVQLRCWHSLRSYSIIKERTHYTNIYGIIITIICKCRLVVHGKVMIRLGHFLTLSWQLCKTVIACANLDWLGDPGKNNDEIYIMKS